MYLTFLSFMKYSLQVLRTLLRTMLESMPSALVSESDTMNSKLELVELDHTVLLATRRSQSTKTDRTNSLDPMSPRIDPTESN